MTADRREDSQLVEDCLGGDPSAWEALVRRYRRLVYSVPVRMRLRAEDADEVFQDTFTTLLEKLATVRDRPRIGLWLMVTARRKALDRVSRGPSTREVELSERLDQPDPGGLTVDDLVRLERDEQVRQAVDRPPERCQKLLRLLFWEDPPPAYRDIARKLGVPEGSLGPTRARCFDKLRREVDGGS